jgi:hypothetical protein
LLGNDNDQDDGDEDEGGEVQYDNIDSDDDIYDPSAADREEYF